MTEEKRMLSPSQIATFLECEYRWYRRYILGITTPPTFAMSRGTLVHEMCCQTAGLKILDVFGRIKSVQKIASALKKHIAPAFELLWEKIAARHQAEATDGEKKKTWKMVENFVDMVRKRAEATKAYSAMQAWSFATPVMAEATITNKDLGLRGTLDAVVDKPLPDGDTLKIVLDYKTSGIYKSPIDPSYYRQGIIYALLLKEATGRAPDFVATDFLADGETVAYRIRDSDIDAAKTIVADVRAGTERVSGTPEAEVVRSPNKFCSFCESFEKCKSDGYVK